MYMMKSAAELEKSRRQYFNSKQTSVFSLYKKDLQLI